MKNNTRNGVLILIFIGLPMAVLSTPFRLLKLVFLLIHYLGKLIVLIGEVGMASAMWIPRKTLAKVWRYITKKYIKGRSCDKE